MKVKAPKKEAMALRQVLACRNKEERAPVPKVTLIQPRRTQKEKQT